MPKRDIATFLVPQNPIAVTTTQHMGASSSLRRSGGGGASAKQQKAVNPDKLVTTVKTDPTTHNTTVALPKYGALQVSVGSEVKSVIRPDAETFPRGFADTIHRGEFGGFQCTSRGDARLLSLPPVRRNATAAAPAASVPARENSSSAAEVGATPDVSAIQSGVTLRDVWRFGMRTKAPLLTEVDTTTIGRPFAPDADKKEQQVRIVRIRPEWLGRGMVQPPQAEIATVDKSVLDDDAARLMTPAQRRELMETQRRAREGLVALREVQAARTKLNRKSVKLYPHGVLGCSDGPYSEHPDEAYAQLSAVLGAEDRKVGRKGKKEAGVTARQHDTAEVVLNMTRKGDSLAGQPAPDQRKSGLQVRGVIRPKDTLANYL